MDIPGRLCADCWSEVSFIVAPLCACCGTPFEIEVEPGSLCGAWLRAPPAFGRARAVVLYKNVGRDLVLAFKMADRTWIVPSLGAWMARAGRELLADADIIAPVPLFRWRLLARRFNQSVLLGAALSRDADAVWMPDLLQRARATKSQARFSANARGAFRLCKRHSGAIVGKSIVLVDDVITTGATVDACVRALLKDGARSVDVLTLARTLDRSA